MIAFPHPFLHLSGGRSAINWAEATSSFLRCKRCHLCSAETDIGYGLLSASGVSEADAALSVSGPGDILTADFYF